ncbi:MAG: sulfotransferase, partial [Coleofasciculus sp. C2-GNP5-27]
MKLPTFLIIGVQKAGTTSIYNYLKQHPQIYMSPVKETNFLEKNWEELETQRKAKIDTFEKYCQLFEGVTDEIAIGEA